MNRQRAVRSAPVGIDQHAVAELLTRARREVEEGLLPSAQVALAYNGELIAFETFGEATNDTRYVVFSSTKPIVAGAIWALIGDGTLDVSRRVAELIPEFAANGKQDVTIEQVLLHTAGFPMAPLRPVNGDTSEGRRAAFARWRLDWEPGSEFEYHPTSAHWVLAELIEVLTGHDFRDVVEQRVTAPAGLGRLVGDVPHRAATLVATGEQATAEELLAAFGVAEVDLGEVTTDALLAFNDPAVQRVGIPGGGGVMRAADLALYYQTILHDDGTIWDPAVLTDATTNVRNRLPDRHTGIPANRTLGLVQAGADGASHLRGMGHTVSARAIGHNGAGGQIAWGDPVSGLSLGYCTNGLDQHIVREGRRTTSIANRAGRCAG